MDAKAKVVAYLVTGPMEAGHLKMSYAYTPEECDNAVNPEHEPLIKLTDHEAAMAELREQLDELVGAKEDAADWYAQFEYTSAKYLTLRTGLEALAGRLHRRELTVPDPSNILLSLIDAIASEIDGLTKKHSTDFPECSGTPNDCPENEGYGCCKVDAHTERHPTHNWQEDGDE